MKLGFLINPIAGMGGRVGLKGTDGAEILQMARELGSIPESPKKSKLALEELLPLKDKFKLYTGPGDMGELIARELGFNPTIVGQRHEETSAKDTEAIASQMADLELDLIIFAGGDGTARNIFNAVASRVPVIGIPAGVKIHSGVYANYPKAAGEIAYNFIESQERKTMDAEVMDIDEESFRKGEVLAKLYGYLRIPQEEELVQTTKSGGLGSEEDALEGIANYIIDHMEEDIFYIIGSGTSIRPIMEKLDLENTLLGVDIIKNKKLVASDVSERTILDTIKDDRAKIIVTVIGGQGYIFGRGNQQISSEVINKVGKQNIIIVAPKNKLLSLEGRPLLVDTGDQDTNQMLNGYMKVLTSYNMETLEEVRGL